MVKSCGDKRLEKTLAKECFHVWRTHDAVLWRTFSWSVNSSCTTWKCWVWIWWILMEWDLGRCGLSDWWRMSTWWIRPERFSSTRRMCRSAKSFGVSSGWKGCVADFPTWFWTGRRTRNFSNTCRQVAFSRIAFSLLSSPRRLVTRCTLCGTVQWTLSTRGNPCHATSTHACFQHHAHADIDPGCPLQFSLKKGSWELISRLNVSQYEKVKVCYQLALGISRLKM